MPPDDATPDAWAVAEAWVARTRAEQGLPDEIEDPKALRRLAALVLRAPVPDRGAETAAAPHQEVRPPGRRCTT